MSLPHDPHWLRAGVWLADGASDRDLDVAILGIPAHESSLSPTRADETPDAIRAALHRYSTYSIAADVDLQDLRVADLGNVDAPDGSDGEMRIRAEVARVLTQAKLLVCLGGDNSITFPIAQGAQADGLITFDAHHDVREGVSNGSPIRRLIDAGFPGDRIVQIGIADFANSQVYSQWARDNGIHVISLETLREVGIANAVQRGFEHLSGAQRIHVDVDVDVCDRSVAPACPASLPGGLAAHELLAATLQVARDPRVATLDITEIDASVDSPDQRTVRLGALIVLRAMLGVALR